MNTATNLRHWKLPFFSLWAAQAFSLLGSHIAGFALVWWLTVKTNSATVLATATLVSQLPGILLGPVAGALVDRWNRRRVMILADGGVALVSAWLAYLFWIGAMQPWHVAVIMVARAIGECFHWPAMQASTSLMVPKEQLARVAGMNQTLHGVMSIIAPPLGALLLAVLPLHGIMGLDVVTALLAIAVLGFVFIPQPVANVHTQLTNVWQDLRAGLRYVAAWPGLCLVGIFATVINLLIQPASALTPILVTRHFLGQAPQLAIMETAFGVGIIAGGLTLSVWGGFKRRMLTTLAGLIIMGAATALVGLVPSSLLPLAVVGMLLSGFAMPIVNGPVFAVIQATVAPEMQGRVFTLLMSAASVAAPLGLALAGPIADRFGAGIWFVVGGIACIVMGLIGFYVPAVLRLEENNHTAAAEVILVKE